MQAVTPLRIDCTCLYLVLRNRSPFLDEHRLYNAKVTGCGCIHWTCQFSQVPIQTHPWPALVTDISLRDMKMISNLYVTCMWHAWGNKTEKVMPTLLGIKNKKKSRVSKTYFNVMQFIFVNYFFIWVLPSEVTCCCPTCCAGPETQHEFNIVHCRVTQYELICFKAVTTQRKKY